MQTDAKGRQRETTITHCFREANKVADMLANIEVSLSTKLTLFETPPQEVRDVLFADTVGARWRRMIINKILRLTPPPHPKKKLVTI